MRRTTPRQARKRRKSPRKRPRSGRTAKIRRRRTHAVGTLTVPQQHRVDLAAEIRASVVTDGWREVVGDRASEYVASSTFARLTRNYRRRRCRFLADIAKAILAGKAKYHDLVGGLADKVMALFGTERIERQFVRELVTKIPLPGDSRLVATARGVQITGILLCVLNGDDLSRCQCSIDLALEQAKTAVEKLLTTALEDWTQLARFGPKA
ncbi:hypothetical protein [Kribbella sp. NPDC000426]|uniref:hypothetical protein n=1 Tax=Kribbella sp. NPDC000426 TaxID=3154255 RepID=UPI00332B3848